IRADPIVRPSATTYSLKGLLSCGGTRTGGAFIYSLISSKAFCCASPHTNTFLSFNNGEKGKTLSDKLDINLLTKLILPSNDCSSVRLVGGTTLSIASM